MFTKSKDKITFADVKDFCREFPEGVRIEYKREIKDIPKIVSSFANALGGIFIIGVEADQIDNKVMFPIQGIPKKPGIEEQIQQSSLTGIYPAVMPEVIILDVPNSNNVVVVVRVDESVQAPHAISRSTKTYIRTGSITQPYELTDIDRIAYMLKRREDSQVVARQILTRIEERTESLCAANEPYVKVIVVPIFPYRPVVATAQIYEVVTKMLEPKVEPSPVRRVPGGSCFLTGTGDTLTYLELNDHGIAYYRGNLLRSEREGQPLTFRYIVERIGSTIRYARSLYKECDYLGNLEVKTELCQVSGEKLMCYEDQPYSRECVDLNVFASTQCLPQDLMEREKLIKIVGELADQLLWAFDVDEPVMSRKLVRETLAQNKQLPN